MRESQATMQDAKTTMRMKWQKRRSEDRSLQERVQRMLLGVVCAMVWVCGAQTAAGQTDAEQEAGSRVEGKVVQEGNGQPIRKVVVELIPMEDNSEQHYTTATDAGGVFKFEGVPPGQYVVTIARAGYVTLSQTEREDTITVEQGQNMTDLRYRMQATGVIAGKIVDAERDPVAGVGVVAIASEKGQLVVVDGTLIKRHVISEGLTNDLGEYRIANLPAGQYVVHTEPKGDLRPTPNPADKGRQKERAVYVETYYPGTLDEKEASTVQVTPGGTARANFRMLTNQTYRVSGMVTGLGRAEMHQILLVGKSGKSQEQVLKEGGKFDFPRVQAGTYEVRVIEATGLGNGQRPTMRFETIRTPIVVSDADLVDLQLQVETGGTVSGKFRMEGEEKVDWTLMRVRLMPMATAGGEGPAESLLATANGQAVDLNEDGSFEMKDVPGGDYELLVSAKTDIFRDYYTKAVMLDGRDVVDTGIQVSGGAALEVVMSEKGASVEGTVVDAKGQPVAGAYVVTAPSSGKRGRPDAYETGRSNDNGHFELHGLNPGEFTVVALQKMSGDARSPEFLQRYGDKGVKVVLEEAERKNVQLTEVEEEKQ